MTCYWSRSLFLLYIAIFKCNFSTFVIWESVDVYIMCTGSFITKLSSILTVKFGDLWHRIVEFIVLKCIFANISMCSVFCQMCLMYRNVLLLIVSNVLCGKCSALDSFKCTVCEMWTKCFQDEKYPSVVIDCCLSNIIQKYYLGICFLNSLLHYFVCL